MSRLISMEDAIRAIEEEWDGCCSEYPATQIIYDTTEAIERLPIIQPEITHEQAVAYLQSTGWMQEHDRQMMLDGVHRLTAQPEPHWIPVEQDLPTEDDDYWATFDAKTGRFVDWASWYQGRWVTWIEGSPAPLSNVIAWCKPVEPYKEVTE